MSGPFQFNPFTFFLDRVGTSGGGGGNITLTSQDGTPNAGTAFTLEGMDAGSAPAMSTSNTGSTFAFENRTWETPYVVDQSETPGLRGTFSTIQDALDAAKADGMTFQKPKKILIRFTDSSSWFNENLNIWSGAYFACDNIGSPPAGAFVHPAVINGNHVLDNIGVFYSQGVNWQATTVDPLFGGGSIISSICASDSIFSNIFLDGPFVNTAGNFNCYFQNCDFFGSADSDTGPFFDCPSIGAVIFQACNFHGVKSAFSGNIPKFYDCQGVGHVTMTNYPLIADDCYFTASVDGQSCVIQNSPAAACEFYNCRFSGSGGEQYALDAPGNIGYFANCFSSGLSTLNSGFVSPGTEMGSGHQMSGNILPGYKTDVDLTLIGDESYIGVTDTSIAQTITLRQGYRNYQVYVADEGGNAGNIPIEVIDLAGGTINGQPSFFISENFGSALFRSIDGTNWIAMGSAAIPNTTLQGTGTSENAATAILINFPLRAVEASYRFKFDIVGREATSGDTVGYTLFGTVKTDGSAATIVATPFTDNDEDSALLDAEVDLVAVGNNVQLQVTGVSTTTILYSAVGSYVVV